MTPLVPPELFRAAMGSFASGVTLVTSIDEAGTPYGLTATAFSSLSAEPPSCLVCVSHEAEARPVIVETGRFAVNVLAAAQQPLSVLFATRGADKFGAGLRWQRGPALGLPLVDGAIAQLECSVLLRHTQGEHDLFVGELHGAAVSAAEPLLYWRGRYGRLARP